MQNKGFISVIAVLLVLICGFYISFSFVTQHFEKEADEYAATKAGTTDVTNDLYKQVRKDFIDSLAKEEVYLGYTYNQVRKMEIGLGLDLKGGMDVVLEISTPDLILQFAKNDETITKKVEAAIKATVDAGNKSSDKDFLKKFGEQFPERQMAPLFKHEGEFLASLKDNASNSEVVAALEKEVESQVTSAFNVFRTRIDQFGVVAPNIQKLPEKVGQILLELPGVKEPERVTDLLQSSANLQFYAVYSLDEVAEDIAAFAVEYQKENPDVDVLKLISALDKHPSMPIIATVAKDDRALVDSIFNSELAQRKLPFTAYWEVKPLEVEQIDPKTKKPILKNNGKPKTDSYWQLIALKGEPLLEGDAVESATSEFDKMRGGNVVNMRMNSEGARAWSSITADNLGKPIAIVLDEKVYSYPTVNTQITGGSSEITGNFSPEEANDLANVLKSGKMTAEVSIVSQSVIGPSLGAEAIEAGFMSFAVAIVLLMVFMVLIYGWVPGLVANLCLILNLFFTMGILASFQAVLTLSGIAGIVLSLGMAVDANVLIFERAKEELKAGKKLRSAIADGYSNAFSAIFDSNLTSVITAVILIYFGSGPIKGFATTLIIGLVCSFFTAVFLSRIIFELLTKNGRLANMSFTTPISRNFLANTKINFLAKTKVSMVVWFALIAVSVFSLFYRGMNQGIDFSGGRNYVVQFEKEVDRQGVEDKLKAEFEGASITAITIDDATKIRVSTNYKIESNDEGIDEEITDKLYNALQEELTVDGKLMSKKDFTVANEKLGITSIQKVGPSVADEMKQDAYLAVSIAVICMFLYILVRFHNIAFSVGAVAAVALTAFLIIGLYSLCWGFLPFSMEIDQSFIAAVLTVIGYQINDTVVVFDRVREMMKISPKEDKGVTINKALNATLSRTFMTSFTTLLVLLCIFFLGGDTIRSFTFAMIFGVVAGTFCSLFMAAPVAYMVMKGSPKKKTAPTRK